jgi:YHS domain-containing protein
MSKQDLVNTSVVSGVNGVALSGYDPVSFFTEDDSKPVNGSTSITSDHKGATYFFVSEDNKQTFESNREKYTPQFGGYCAYGISVDGLFPIDVATAQIYKNKLYINKNQDILAMFEKDKDEVIAKATEKWPGLVKEHIN